MATGSIAIISAGAMLAAVLGVGAGIAARPDYRLPEGPRFDCRAGLHDEPVTAPPRAALAAARPAARGD